MVGAWRTRVRWRLLAAFIIVVAVGSFGWFTRALWTPLVAAGYSALPQISVVLGFAFVVLGIFHARQLATRNMSRTARGFQIKLLGPAFDPILEGMGYATAFHTSASVMGRMFFDVNFDMPWGEKVAFGLALGGLMYWSLREPTLQFAEIFVVKGGAVVHPSDAPPPDSGPPTPPSS